MKLGKSITFCHWEWGRFSVNEGNDGPAVVLYPYNELYVCSLYRGVNSPDFGGTPPQFC